MTADGARESRHVFTVDVEEYFHVTVFEGVVARESWDRMPSRIERGVDRLLDLLARYETRGTFFTLGWVADRHPGLVRRIAEAGHEIGSHGWSHRRIPTLEREEVRRELHDSRTLLEDVTGRPVLGFRAPSFSLVPGTEWVYDLLLETGYRYDSSIFPIRWWGYGYPGATPVPHEVERNGGRLMELPLATATLAGTRLPAAGGAYLRILPYALVRRGLRQAARGGRSAVVYVHPWEVDPGQPRLPVSGLSRFRHYHGIGRMMSRLEQLLEEFSFTSIERAFGIGERAPTPSPQGTSPQGTAIG